MLGALFICVIIFPVLLFEKNSFQYCSWYGLEYAISYLFVKLNSTKP